MSYKYIKTTRKIAFWLFIILLPITFFTRNSYRQVSNIDPRVLIAPVQSEATDKNIIRFTKGDFEYELTPLYDYDISGLIVHRMDYTWFDIYKYDSIFPLDLCMIWGSNVESGVYKNKSLSFSQDARFCWYQWFGNLTFNGSELSNNHLLVKDKALEDKIKSLNSGDQVRIKGKLVNVSGRNIGSPGEYDPSEFNIHSSITRSDAGAGACEVIYFEDLEILKKGNPISSFLFEASYYGLIILILWWIIDLIWYVFFSKEPEF
jgi:hypothetical protein